MVAVDDFDCLALQTKCLVLSELRRSIWAVSSGKYAWPVPHHLLTICLLFRKTPWKLSITRKANARARLKKVDAVIETVRASGVRCNALEKALQLPKEHEMDPKDKYTVFSATSKGYRKGIHKVPKWTRLTLRVNPKGF
ncbi:hypothetical protein AZE42_03550 [Rhizopogon vesiculosus]|uniref:54S ribosomal protein L31, mitochondrial n=1 Tax=Rhizopogon vesiculosus TaxID=180088 RepID=A0A1J8Q9V4_9AGAM|nr:hypothetical protein AZE42_03550 [Rhizopogon vesiculosus]